MTPIPRSIGPHESLSLARDLMSDNAVRHLPVVVNGELVGMITACELRLPPGVAGRVVEDVMTNEPYAVLATTPLNTVAREMARRKISSAVVMEGKNIAGILTEVDAFNALADALEGKHARALGEEITRVPPRGRTRPTASRE